MRGRLWVLFGLVGCSEVVEPPLPPPAVEAVPAAVREPVREEPEHVTKTVPRPSAGAVLEDEANTIDVYEAVGPATVFVTQTQLVRSPFSMRALEVPAGSGTGFVWDDQGHIVTNFHVVDGARSLSVTLSDQSEWPATVVGVEPTKDLAVLRIEAPADLLTAVALPPEGQQLRVGQKTLAIGNPFGLDHTLTVGVISALGREVQGYSGLTIRDMIQTDAAINPGNSGGPLLDSQGRLIGVNTMIYSQSGSSAGIGFAVPVETVRRVVPQIIRDGHAERVGLGVSLLPDSVARRVGVEGVIIHGVTRGSPAEAVGLRGVREGRIGDVIVGLEEEVIADYDDLFNALDGRSAGDRISLQILREGQPLELEVDLTRLQ